MTHHSSTLILRSLAVLLCAAMLFASSCASTAASVAARTQGLNQAQLKFPAIEAKPAIAQGEALVAWILTRHTTSAPRQEPDPLATSYLDVRLFDETGHCVRSCPNFDNSTVLPAEFQGQFDLAGAIVPFDLETRTGHFYLVVWERTPINNGGPTSHSALPIAVHSFDVVARQHTWETIPLDKKSTTLRAIPDPQKLREALAMQALLASPGLSAQDSDWGNFAFPVTGFRVSAAFGDRRHYAYASGGSDTAIHYGIDMALPEGSPIAACAKGRVVFAEPRIVTGNTVVLEHGPGVFSIYMHMSSILVQKGQLLQKGEEIGKVGSTGVSTGPHVHWEMRAQGIAIDPESWLAEPLLDISWLSSKLVRLQ